MKKPDLPYLVCQKSKGKEYWYFRRGGDRIALPSPDDPSFYTEYASAKSGRKRIPTTRNFRKLIEIYKSDPHYKALAPRTRKDYSKVMDYLLDIVGDDDPAKMIRRDVIEAQMENTHRARFANEVVAQLSRLMECAINLAWMTHNPAKGVSKLKTGDGHHPWPDTLVEKYAEAATGTDLTIFELGIGTGQRMGDVLAMRWSDVEGDGINITQKKTGTALYVPFTARLSLHLSTVKKTGLWIVTTKHGQQMHYNTAEQRFRRIRKKVGGEGFVMHGWRYTAAHQLVLAGCTDAEIAAITGHKSLEMVAKYSRKASQRGLAESAQKKRT